MSPKPYESPQTDPSRNAHAATPPRLTALAAGCTAGALLTWLLAGVMTPILETSTGIDETSLLPLWAVLMIAFAACGAAVALQMARRRKRRGFMPWRRRPGARR